SVAWRGIFNERWSPVERPCAIRITIDVSFHTCRGRRTQLRVGRVMIAGGGALVNPSLNMIFRNTPTRPPPPHRDASQNSGEVAAAGRRRGLNCAIGVV